MAGLEPAKDPTGTNSRMRQGRTEPTPRTKSHTPVDPPFAQGGVGKPSHGVPVRTDKASRLPPFTQGGIGTNRTRKTVYNSSYEQATYMIREKGLYVTGDL